MHREELGKDRLIELLKKASAKSVGRGCSVRSTMWAGLGIIDLELFSRALFAPKVAVGSMEVP